MIARSKASSKTRRMLFVGHTAERTGAPLMLLHFLRWLEENSDVRFEILLNHGGELVPEYSLVAPTYVLNDRAPQTRAADLLMRIRRRLRPQRELQGFLRRRYPVAGFPVVYSNTVANGELVRCLGRLGHRVICHAHEMRFAMARWGGDSARESAPMVHSFIAASHPVKRDLSEFWNLPESRIEVIHEFGQPRDIPEASLEGCRRRVRDELRIPESTIVVGMCGTVDWRKGADLFPLFARQVKRRCGTTRFHFMWVGSRAKDPEHLQLMRDIELLNLASDTTVVGEVTDAQKYMTAFDLFVLTSREDPCPLAMLESAALGVPIICFADSGGAPDFVGSDAGAFVPYLDLESLADAVLDFGSNPSRRLAAGQAARRRAASAHTLHSQAPKLLAVIERNFESLAG